MRDKSSSFGQRRPDQQEEHLIKTRYFLAFEGEKTEMCYFVGFRKEIKTKLIEIILCPRKKGRSHPKQVFAQVLKLITEKDMTRYNKDEVCMIVDRDPMSFTEDQYTQIVSECKNSRIQFYVTNPRFEFWLLLHFFSKDQLDLEKIRAPQERYIEARLCECCPNFNKSQYDFTCFEGKVSTAIKNEKAFCEDQDQLKDNIGCNIGLLMTKLMN